MEFVNEAEEGEDDGDDDADEGVLGIVFGDSENDEMLLAMEPTGEAYPLATCSGTSGSRTPSNSPSLSTNTSPSSPSPSLAFTSSRLGKKFLNNASACQGLACLNSIQTSIRPGLESAGSSRSKWFVVANKMRPSAAATPSSALSKPESESVLTSESESSFFFFLFESPSSSSDSSPFPLLSLLSPLFFLPPGAPVDVPSLDVDLVNAASKSSNKTIHLAGTRPMRVVNVLSFIHDAERETT